MRIYVASSWRNPIQPKIVDLLRSAGYSVYDFRHPRLGDNGFKWSDIDPLWQKWTPEQFREALDHPIAVTGFAGDFFAMKTSDACVLVLPAGRSAHLEAGYFVGEGKPLLILLSDGEPELMYAMTEHIYTNVGDLSDALRRLS
jgi:hypothetical protein